MYALARDFPDLQFSLNGGVELGSTAQTAIERAPSGGGRIHGVMIGRGAYNMPWTSLSSADSHIFGWPAESPPTRRQVPALFTSAPVRLMSGPLQPPTAICWMECLEVEQLAVACKAIETSTKVFVIALSVA